MLPKVKKEACKKWKLDHKEYALKGMQRLFDGTVFTCVLYTDAKGKFVDPTLT